MIYGEDYSSQVLKLQCFTNKHWKQSKHPENKGTMKQTMVTQKILYDY